METRSSIRIPIELDIAWKIDKHLGQLFSLAAGDKCRTNAFDISAGGMGIISKYFLPCGLRIKLAFSGNKLGLDKFFIRTKGEIRYCNYIRHSNYKCGIKFIDSPLLYSKKFNEFKANYEKRKESRINFTG